MISPSPFIIPKFIVHVFMFFFETLPRRSCNKVFTCSSSCSSPFWVRSRLHTVTPQAGRRRLLILASSWKLLCWSGVLVDGGDCLDCQQQEELPLHHPPPPPPPAATDRIEKAIYPARRLIWVFSLLYLRGLWMDSVDVVKVLSMYWLLPVMVDSAGFFYCFFKNIYIKEHLLQCVHVLVSILGRLHYLISWGKGRKSASVGISSPTCLSVCRARR